MWHSWEKLDMDTHLPSETLESRVHSDEAGVDEKKTSRPTLLTLRFEYLI
jgi:hypothetical protein